MDSRKLQNRNSKRKRPGFDGRKAAAALYGGGKTCTREHEYFAAFAAGRVLAKTLSNTRLEATRDALNEEIQRRTQRAEPARPSMFDRPALGAPVYSREKSERILGFDVFADDE